MTEETFEQISQDIRNLTLRFDALEALLAELAGRICRRPDPQVISWAEVARLLDIQGKNPTEAARRRVRRERERVDGARLRLLRGGVHRGDFLAWLETLAARRPGSGELIRGAIKR